MGVDLYSRRGPRNLPSWVLAVDYGTTYTTAAIREGNRVDLVQVSDSPWIPSTVLLDTEGQLLAGHSAEAQAAIYPDRFERTPKRYVGDVPLMLGGYVVPVQDALAATLHLVSREAIRLQGGPPAELRLTHPARWQAPRLAVLHSAAVRAGLPAPVLVPEPVAAAVHFASRTARLGERLAVYDFGGGTFDTAVLQRTARGFTVLPEPGGDDQLGGEDLDYALYKRLLAAVEQDDPAAAERLRSSDERLWVATRMQFLAAVRAAKERLSDEQVTRLFVQPPVGPELRLTRDELQQTIHPMVARTVGELDRTIRGAGCGPNDLAGI
jgi:molecular chaperone DnaK (HSP70)